MSYFYLLEYNHSWVGPTLFVVNTTDVACHLWLYWTSQKMRVHKRALDDRGLLKLSDPDYCFWGWTRVEQNEPGDTYSHTFNFGPWEYCNWRWWVFRAQMAGEWSTSITCIFTAHYETYTEDESNRHIDLTAKDPRGYIDHAPGSITGDKLRYPFAFPELPRTPAGFPTQDFEVSNKGHVDHTIADAIRRYRETYPWIYPWLLFGAWLTWDLSAEVHPDARFVEIVHRNLDPALTLLAGSRKPGSGLNRRRPLYPGDLFTWFTELSPILTIEVYPQTTQIQFFLMGEYS